MYSAYRNNRCATGVRFRIRGLSLNASCGLNGSSLPHAIHLAQRSTQRRGLGRWGWGWG